MGDSEESSKDIYVKDRVKRIANTISQQDLDAFEQHILPSVTASVPVDKDKTLSEVTIATMIKVAKGEYDRAQELQDSELLEQMKKAFDYEMQKRQNDGPDGSGRDGR